VADVIEIEILADGSLKTSTGRVSAANHGNAEKFLLDLARGCGGQTTRTRKVTGLGIAVHGHSHVHGGQVHSHA